MKDLKILASIVTILLFVMLSCNKNTELASLSSIEGSQLALTKVDDLIPDVYQESEEVTFVNGENESIELNVLYEQVFEERIIGEKTEYFSEKISVALFNQQENIDIVVIASTNYNNNALEVLESLNVILMPGYKSIGGGWISLVYKDSKLTESDNYLEDVNLLNRSFGKVYVNKANPDIQAEYSEIYYNADYGVIGFRDRFNELWVLDNQ